MNNTVKVIFNTAILYFKIVVSMAISLVTVPLVLRALGESDYGLYNLIAGVISMLSFLNASMAVSTQRYMSVAIGENNQENNNTILNTSIMLHLIIGVLIVLLFEIAAIFLFHGKLNIADDRLFASKLVYQFLVVSTFFTVLSVPFNAALNAKENMLIFSVIGIVESLLKLGLAYCLISYKDDRLILYGLGISLITLLSTFLSWTAVKILYKEFRIKPMRYFKRKLFFEMCGFASWNTLGAVAMIGRNQGIAIIINLFFGTVANAAYGIANQINGVLGYFSSTFQKALNPQLMQSEGMRDRNRLIRISMISSKFSVMVLALFAIPLIIEMPYVLTLWLKDVPDNTVRLSQLVLLLSLVYQYSVGLMSAIQAVGKIRSYFLIMSGLILLNLPICYFVFSKGYPIHYAIWIFIIVEFVSLCARLYMSKELVGVCPTEYINTVILPTLSVIIPSLLLSLIPHCLLDESFLRLAVVSITYLILFSVLMWFRILDSQQRRKLIKKIKRK